MYIQCNDDDILFFSNIKGMISELKAQLSGAFGMKDLGAARYILGMEIKRIKVTETFGYHKVIIEYYFA